MKLKLHSIIAAVVVFTTFISGVYAQANLTFSGGNGTPLSITLQQSVTYTINNTQCTSRNLGFVSDEVGNPFNLNAPTVSGTITYTINGGAAQSINLTQSGFNSSNISANDLIFFRNASVTAANGSTITLSAGTITTTGNITAAPPANGSFTTFIANGDGVPCSANGVAVAPTAAPVSISGRVLTSKGRGLVNAFVYLTDQEGNTRMTRTTAFGYYRFEDVRAGQAATLTVVSKQHQYAPKVVGLNEAVSNLDFIAER